jgi:hypothetical protein
LRSALARQCEKESDRIIVRQRGIDTAQLGAAARMRYAWGHPLSRLSSSNVSRIVRRLSPAKVRLV